MSIAALFMSALIACTPADDEDNDTAAPQTCDTDPALSESLGFQIDEFVWEHQGETNTVDLLISYRYMDSLAVSDYPNYVPMIELIEFYLTDYPNESDYMEIVNTSLTQMLLDTYTAMAQITVQIHVAPSEANPNNMVSTVTRARSGCTVVSE